MATPGEMVRRMAEALSLPESMVIMVDRKLSESGLRTKSGRGKSAAKMTASDIANLLIAVIGSSMMRDETEAVAEYGALPVQKGRLTPVSQHGFASVGPAWELSDAAASRLPLLGAAHTFRDALVTLLEDASVDGSSRLPDHTHSPLSEPIRVKLYGPHPEASISLSTGLLNGREQHPYAFTVVRSDMRRFNGSSRASSPFEATDLNQTVEFTSKTLLALGDLLRS